MKKIIVIYRGFHIIENDEPNRPYCSYEPKDNFPFGPMLFCHESFKEAMESINRVLESRNKKKKTTKN